LFNPKLFHKFIPEKSNTIETPDIMIKGKPNTIKKQFLFIAGLLLSVIALSNDFVFTPINVSHGLSDNQIRYILQLPDGRMVFTTNGNINLYDGTQFKYLHRTDEHVYPLSKYNGFYRIFQSGDSLLWIKEQYKLMCIDLYQEKHKTDLSSYFRNKGVNDPIDDLFLDSEQRMWLLTSGKLLQPESSLELDLSSNQGNLQDIITESNKLYLFYNTGVIICYDLSTRELLYESAAYPESERANFQNTSLVVKGKDGFYQLRNGNRGGFFHFNPENRTWKTILTTNYHLNTLLVTPDEVAYISSPQGIRIIDPRSGKQEYLPELKTIEGNTIRTEISTIFYDKQGGLWVGTLNRGLLYYHPSRYTFKHIGRASFPGPASEDLAIQAFAEDYAGRIFIKCHSVIYLYHPEADMNNILLPLPTPVYLSEKVRKEFDQHSARHVYQGKSYTTLCTDTRGWTWAGTPDGLELFTPETDSKRTFYTDDGLSNNFVHAILEDRQGQIWITTSCGISQAQVDPDSKMIHFTNFNAYDGTLEGEYCDNSIYEATDGTLYFGGIDGFNVLHPANLVHTHLPYKAIFTNLRLRGEEIKPGQTYDNRVILSKAAPYTTDIELSYNQNFLTFDFSALNYLNQAKTCYRYFLDGIDTEWHETAVGRETQMMEANGILQAAYTNLPPGKYTLKVIASDNSRQWDGEVTTLNIRIHAPWWKTTTAYTLYIILFLLITAGSIYLYLYISRKRLEQQHKEEILLLRIKNLIEQRNLYEEGLNNETNNTSIENENLNAVDATFLSKAMEQVEKNLNAPGYSVEQLSRDLCMDRTGLYRKLIALLDESPSLFIRNIRLKKAAQLILEGELSITEISETVGFSTTSYMSKCFQEMYGCRPSEYAKMKKST